MSITWSPYSEAIFDTWLSQPKSNIIVSACPGSGKTTNLKYLCTDIIDPREETCYLAFAKSNVEEAKATFPLHMKENIMTLNGLGHRAIINEYGWVMVDKDKVFKIIRKECKQGRQETKQEYNDRVGEIAKAVGLLKINGDVREYDFSAMCDTFDIDQYEGMYQECAHVLVCSDADIKTIDFNDQLRFPVLYALDMPSFDNVLVDESQDLNALQAAMVYKLNGRYCFVGDPHQAIYGFRGAMADSMAYLKDTFDCVELPLKLSYRCPKSVVGEARLLFDDIEALPDAPSGSVSYGMPPYQTYQATDLILCRYNAPLISYAYDLLKRGIPCRVRGRDIGTGLIRLINKLGSPTVFYLCSELHVWRQREKEKAKGDKAKEQRVNDRADSLLAIASQCQAKDHVEIMADKIRVLFDASTGVLLSTVHKAKGLEADSVYILQHRLMPSKYAVRDWEIEQERNIQYVAVTRSRSNLVYM